MKCLNCNNTIEDNSNYCQFWGFRVNSYSYRDLKPDEKIEKDEGAELSLESNEIYSRYSPLRKKIFIFEFLGIGFVILLPFVFSKIAYSMGDSELKKYPHDWMVRVGRVVGKVFTYISIVGIFYHFYFLFVIALVIIGLVSGQRLR